MLTDTGHSVAEPIGDSRIHVVRNAALEELLFDRNLTGVEFRRTCLRCSRHFIAHVVDELAPDDTAELMILSKGLVYQLGEAMAAEAGRNLPTNMIATGRAAVTQDAAQIEVPYVCFEAPADTLIIGDTVASGATIIAAVRRYLDSHPLRRLYVISFAGTRLGASRIAEFCSKRDVQTTFLYGLAAFGLGDNGFDLSFLHPDTITESVYVDHARRQFEGKAVSAVGWDFGSQSMAPRKYRHLGWIESEVWALGDAKCFAFAEEPDDWSALAHERAAYERVFRRPGKDVPPLTG
ncbi:hypothetical protein SAMN04489713_1424 [Actinomadura madurae]|uniref:Phosphoribosyl transferase domain-containing protein n=1 Tax=Actinomadura madurae TaxID=1993 RepID=A0A1I5YYR7_9ACTN|nr:hypothetical protein [Actinomadura madurae]SFQ49356.1 hypothetical protein SAMN04489713_1424 [Actinomadura madurae]